MNQKSIALSFHVKKRNEKVASDSYKPQISYFAAC